MRKIVTLAIGVLLSCVLTAAVFAESADAPDIKKGKGQGQMSVRDTGGQRTQNPQELSVHERGKKRSDVKKRAEELRKKVLNDSSKQQNP